MSLYQGVLTRGGGQNNKQTAGRCSQFEKQQPSTRCISAQVLTTAAAYYHCHRRSSSHCPSASSPLLQALTISTSTSSTTAHMAFVTSPSAFYQQRGHFVPQPRGHFALQQRTTPGFQEISLIGNSTASSSKSHSQQQQGPQYPFNRFTAANQACAASFPTCTPIHQGTRYRTPLTCASSLHIAPLFPMTSRPLLIPVQASLLLGTGSRALWSHAH